MSENLQTNKFQGDVYISASSDPSVYGAGNLNIYCYLYISWSISTVLVSVFTILSLEGTSSGTITIKGQANSGTYNFNMPITAGNNGQVLTSGGGNTSTMSWTTPITSIGLSVPSFLSISNSPLSANGTLILSLSGSALPVTSGGTGTTTSTGSGNVVLSNTPSLITPNLGSATGVSLNLSGAINSAATILTGSISGTIVILPQSITGSYNFNLPTSAGTSGQVLTSGGGTTSAMTWTTPTIGTVTSVSASVPSFLSITGSPITSSGTLAITYSGTALPITSGGTGSTSATGTGSVVLANTPTLTTPILGVATGVSLNLSASLNSNIITLFGSTNSIITITPKSIPETYNFNLPTTSGSSGQFLTSTGGATAMLWTTPTLGTVTSVSVSVPSFLSISGSPITTSGTFSISYSGSALPVTSGGTGSTISTGSGAVVLANGCTLINPILGVATGTSIDLTGNINSNTISLSGLTSGIITIQPQTISGTYNFNLPVSSGTAGQVLTSQGGGVNAMTWTEITNGTVTSVSASVPSFLNVTGSPITTSGTLAITYSGTALPVANGGTGSVTSTGTGSVVLANTPTLIAPVLGSATGVSISLTGQYTSSVSTGTPPFIISSTTNVANLNASFLNGNTFESPGEIGATVASSGIFTTLASWSLFTANNGITIATGTLTAITGSFTGNINMNSNKITDLGTPTLDTDAATKGYVDSASEGLHIKESVIVTTTTTGTLTTSFANGSVLDGVTLVTGNRILIKNQTNAIENGIYTVNSSGSPTRSTDLPTGDNAKGSYVFIEQGTIFGNCGFVCTTVSGSDIVGTNTLTFVQFSGAENLVAGTGLTKTGNTLSVNSSQSQINEIGTLSSLLVTGNISSNTHSYLGSTSGIITINPQAVTGSYNFNLPITSGSSGQVLTSQGGGSSAMIWSNIGSGTVTSVAASVPSFLSISGSPITSSGTLAITLSGTALPITSGGTGSTTSTGSGSVVLANGPTLNTPVLGVATGTSISLTGNINSGSLTFTGSTSGIITIQPQAAAGSYNFNLPTTSGTSGQVLTSQGGSTAMTWTTPTIGTVTSVSATVPTFLSISGSPITSSGTLAITYSGTALPVANGGTGSVTSTGSGSVVLANTPTLITPNLGAATGVSINLTGNINSNTISLSGITSGIITIQPQAIAGTYNFNLPVSAGTSGQVLTSQGGNTNAMTWSTVGSGTVTSVSATVPSFLSITGSPITNSGTLAITYSGTALPVANGGTGSVTSTGSGSVVLANTPTLITPVLGSATGVSISLTGQYTSTVSTGTAPLVVSSSTNVANLNASLLNGNTFANPGAIGSTTPSTGAFTTITSNSTTNSTSISTGAVILSGGLSIAKSLFLGSNITQSAPNNTGAYFQLYGSVFTDSSTAASSTLTNWYNSYIGTPTLAATNSNVTTTTASTFYIAGAPIVGTNETITNRYSLNIATGDINLGTGRINFVNSNSFISANGAGTWINLTTAGPSAIGSGGVGVNPWIAYCVVNGNFFTDALAGDLAYRNTGGQLLLGTTSGTSNIKINTSGDVTINNTTNTTSVSTGALIISGSTAISKCLNIGSSHSNSTSSSRGSFLNINASTFTDTSTATSGTLSLWSQSYYGISTIAATNTSVTNTIACTLHLAGSPVAGTNITIGTSYSLYIAGGNNYLGTGTTLADTLQTKTLNLTGSTSGTISVLPQAAAGTYNFNLPTTAGSSGQILTSAGGAGSPMTWTTLASNTVPTIWYLSDQKSSGTNGGTFTSGGFGNFILNTIVSSQVNTAVTLNATTGEFTITPGKYFIEANIPGYKVGVFLSVLLITSTLTTVLTGTSVSSATGDSTTSISTIKGILTVASTTTYGIYARCASTRNNDGKGLATGFGIETYSTVVISEII